MRSMIWVLVLGASLFAQDAKKKGARNFDGPIDPAKVDAAIKKGVSFLKTADDNWAMLYGGELTLLALATAGRDIIPEQDPFFQDLLKKVLESKLTHTYQVSLTAMCLEEIDRVKYQKRIWQCAQFLVDNQGPNGQWKYSEPDPFADEIPTGKPVKKEVATADGSKAVREFSGTDASKRPQKPKVVQTLSVTKRRDGPVDGDSSNAQYAALGLRACHDSGILIPEDVITKAYKWWVDLPAAGGSEGKATPTGNGAHPRSWGYVPAKSGCGCMTAGAIGSLAIYRYILDNDGGRKKSWMTDPAVQGGLAWMGLNFRVTEMGGTCDALVGAPEHKKGDLLYYWLYASERAGMLYGREQFGQHSWYVEGAELLLKTQSADGSWNEEGVHSRPLWNTALAILFLKRATRPLADVASVDKFAPK